MSREVPTNVSIRAATRDDRLGVRRVLDAAMLDVREDLPERLSAGDVLVATAEPVASEGDADGANPVLGALVLVPDTGAAAFVPDDEGATVDAVAVRRARRGQGVGSALIRAAAERHGRLTAEFDPDVQPFYESLGFEIEPVEGEDDRLRGTYNSGSP